MAWLELKSKLGFFTYLGYSDEGDYKVYYNNGKGNVSINFNICEYTFRKCPDGALDFANEINQNNTCDHLSSSSLHDVGVSLIDENKGDLGLRLFFTGGNMCNDTHKFQL